MYIKMSVSVSVSVSVYMYSFEITFAGVFACFVGGVHVRAVGAKRKALITIMFMS